MDKKASDNRRDMDVSPLNNYFENGPRAEAYHRSNRETGQHTYGRFSQSNNNSTRWSACHCADYTCSHSIAMSGDVWPGLASAEWSDSGYFMKQTDIISLIDDEDELLAALAAWGRDKTMEERAAKVIRITTTIGKVPLGHNRQPNEARRDDALERAYRRAPRN
jgi:hypothetical protein